MVLGAVVEVVQLLLEVVQDLGVTCHVCGEDQDDHIPSDLLMMVNGHQGLIEESKLTITLNSSSDMLAKILDSGELRILNDTAQW